MARSSLVLLGILAPLALLAAPEPPESRLFATATVTARPLDQATASVTVLQRQEIEALGVVSVAELMRFVAGVDLSSSGPRGGYATAQIRGGEPNFTVILLDGVPLNDATDLSGGAVNLNGMSTAHVERIEIVRGPLSSFFGSTGLAGVVNVITRRGEDPAGEIRAQADAGAARYARGAASFGQGGERRDHFVGATWDQEEDRIADDGFEQTAIQGNAGFAIGDRSRVRVSGRATTWEAEDYPDASGGPRLGSGATRFTEHEEASLGLDWELGNGPRPHRFRTVYYHHDLERDSPGVAPLVPPSVEHTRYAHWRGGWTHPLVQGAAHQLSIGAELVLETGDNDSRLLLPPEFGGEVDGSYAIDRRTAGAFVEWLASRGPLLFELGARLDDPERFDAELNPRAGVTYALPDRKTRLRLSAGRAYKLPSFFALASPPQLGGNPDLVPEVVVGADGGVEHRFERAHLGATVTLFFYRYRDLIDFDFETFQSVNRSRVESRGVETALDWTPIDRVRVAASVTRQELDVLSSDASLRQRPEWIGSARATWHLAEKLFLEADVQGVSRRFDQQIPVPERTTVAGYAIVGAAGRYRLTPAWELSGRIDNLLDRDYETFIGFPGAGRSFRLGLSFAARTGAVE